MLLYKYLKYDHKLILENGLIRFTQPSCFNDPFEALPKVEQALSNEAVQTLHMCMFNDLLFNDLISNIDNNETIKTLNKLRNSLRKDSPEDLKAFYLKLLGKSEEDLTAGMKMFWDNKIGILCLSEENDNLTMWAHYTDNHKGFAIGINPQKNITDPKTCFMKPRKVRYTCNRPHLTLFEFGIDKNTRNTKWVNEFLYTKSKDWAYENEWRQVNFLERADKIENEEEKIHLFKYNRNSIEEIILGCKMLPEKRKIILELVKDWDIRIYQMKLNDNNYSLDKIRIN